LDGREREGERGHFEDGNRSSGGSVGEHALERDRRAFREWECLREDFSDIFVEPDDGIGRSPLYIGAPGFDYREWNECVRRLSGYDPERYQTVAERPLRETLLAYRECLKSDAREHYRLERIVWASLAPHIKDPPDAPDLPPILNPDR
jgi:hypothetical protein